MGRIALVTGGTTGIGAAVCKMLKAAGYTVAANNIVYGDDEKAFELAAGIKVFEWDVSDADQCVKGVERVAEAMGGPIEVLVNNAGITKDGVMQKMAVEDWDNVINTDLSSCFYMSRAVINGMREMGFGRIINISSVNGRAGQIGQTNYSSAKAGIIGFTKALAQENAPKGITVNAVAPGYTLTNMVKAIPEPILQIIVEKIPVRRLGQPEEIARTVLFLAADEAGFIVGETISVNGGLRMD